MTLCLLSLVYMQSTASVPSSSYQQATVHVHLPPLSTSTTMSPPALPTPSIPVTTMLSTTATTIRPPRFPDLGPFVYWARKAHLSPHYVTYLEALQDTQV